MKLMEDRIRFKDSDWMRFVLVIVRWRVPNENLFVAQYETNGDPQTQNTRTLSTTSVVEQNRVRDESAHVRPMDWLQQSVGDETTAHAAAPQNGIRGRAVVAMKLQLVRILDDDVVSLNLNAHESSSSRFFGARKIEWQYHCKYSTS